MKRRTARGKLGGQEEERKRKRSRVAAAAEAGTSQAPAGCFKHTAGRRVPATAPRVGALKLGRGCGAEGRLLRQGGAQGSGVRHASGLPRINRHASEGQRGV